MRTFAGTLHFKKELNQVGFDYFRAYLEAFLKNSVIKFNCKFY